MAQDVSGMLGHFAHPEDARGFRVGKLILFKDVHTDQASITCVGSSQIHLCHLPWLSAQEWASHRLFLTEIPSRTGELLSAWELGLLLAESIGSSK